VVLCLPWLGALLPPGKAEAPLRTAPARLGVKVGLEVVPPIATGMPLRSAVAKLRRLRYRCGDHAEASTAIPPPAAEPPPFPEPKSDELDYDVVVGAPDVATVPTPAVCRARTSRQGCQCVHFRSDVNVRPERADGCDQ
jgi:hypothetical protein